MGESRLVGAWPAEVHTATLTAGHRRSVGQRHRGVATVPADDQGVGRRPVLEPTRQQRGFFVSGIKSISKTGLSVAAFAIHEASPEQSVPAGESPPEIYGVPET